MIPGKVRTEVHWTYFLKRGSKKGPLGSFIQLSGVGVKWYAGLYLFQSVALTAAITNAMQSQMPSIFVVGERRIKIATKKLECSLS
jgi:hypothetical protein